MFISNNRASFHLSWKENLVKHQRVSKHYENDCRQTQHNLSVVGKNPSRCHNLMTFNLILQLAEWLKGYIDKTIFANSAFHTSFRQFRFVRKACKTSNEMFNLKAKNVDLPVVYVLCFRKYSPPVLFCAGIRNKVLEISQNSQESTCARASF